MQRGTPLTNEQQNVLRVILAALLAMIIMIVAFLLNSPKPIVAVTLLLPGIPIFIANIVSWRVKMVW